MKIITFEDIKKLGIEPLQCYNWTVQMLTNKKDVILPAKISMKPSEEVFCNVMPCILNNGFGGVKVVTRYPGRNPSLDSRLILFNSHTGEFLALMDADWITTMRTGAVAAHSISLLAKKDFKKISIMGLGNTARAALLVLLSIFPQRYFNIKLLRYKNQEKSFAERFKNYNNIAFDFVDDYASLIKEADVVISAVTYFAEDICADEYFDKGVTVIPIHTRGFTNCDLFFDKVFADDINHVHHFKNFDKFKNFAEVSEVVNGTKQGRTNDDERIIAYNIGISMHDIYFASKIYELCSKKVLTEVNMLEPNQKFWI